MHGKTRDTVKTPRLVNHWHGSKLELLFLTRGNDVTEVFARRYDGLCKSDQQES